MVPLCITYLGSACGASFVVGDAAGLTALDGLQGQQRLVAHRRSVALRLTQIVHTDMQRDGNRQVIVGEAGVEIVVALLQGHGALGAEPGKVVGVQVCGKAVLPLIESAHVPGQIPQQLIAHIPAVQAVDVTEAVHVVPPDAELLPRVPVYPLLRPPVKADSVHHAGQRVDLTAQIGRGVLAGHGDHRGMLYSRNLRRS